MFFAVHYTLTTQNRNAVYERLQKFGTEEPAGVKIVSNWHSVTQLEGWAIIEADDAEKVAQNFHIWTDLAVNHVTPVVDTATMMKVISM